MTARLESLRAVLAERQLAAMAVWSDENRRYLSGFTGSSGCLLVTERRALLLTDFRYLEQAGAEAAGWEIVRSGDSMAADLGRLLAEEGLRQLALEAEHVTYAQFQELQEKLSIIRLVPTRGLVENLRLVKDEQEIGFLRRAAEIADAAFAGLAGSLRPGCRESEVAAELEFAMRRLGSQEASFATIVASGPRSALPHGIAGERRLAEGDLVVLDFGAVYQGYHSDITRTVAIGTPTSRQRELYDTVLASQEKALQGIRAGLGGREADALARDFLEHRGYGQQFGHGLGHGVGLAVHEGPNLSPRSTDQLQPGMAVTVEPGVYLEGWGGIRIEDLVIVQEKDCQVLTAAPKGLWPF